MMILSMFMLLTIFDLSSQNIVAPTPSNTHIFSDMFIQYQYHEAIYGYANNPNNLGLPVNQNPHPYNPFMSSPIAVSQNGGASNNPTATSSVLPYDPHSTPAPSIWDVISQAIGNII